MTAGSTSAIDGQGGALMPTGSNAISPADFAARCREIVTTLKGHEMHRAFDEETNALLSSLGYSEGCDIFIAAVAPLHPKDHPQ